MSSTFSRPNIVRASCAAGPESVCLLTTAQLAQLLGVSQRKLERDRQDGTGAPFIKIGRRVLYRRSDVEAHLEARLFCCTAEAKSAGEDR